MGAMAALLIKISIWLKRAIVVLDHLVNVLTIRGGTIFTAAFFPKGIL